MPIHVADAAVGERLKYEAVWSTVAEYRDYSPGLENVERFVKVMDEPLADMLYPPTLLDIGCGAGVAGLEFAKLGFDFWYLDIVNAGLVDEVPRDRFFQMPLWSNDWPNPCGRWDYGFCCDVMEHIPPEYTMLVVDRILRACEVAWFQIANMPDEFGAAIGQPLHLTVAPYAWWLEKISALGEVVDARDLCGNSLFVVRR